jgi:hypothetical protein
VSLVTAPHTTVFLTVTPQEKYLGLSVKKIFFIYIFSCPFFIKKRIGP